MSSQSQSRFVVTVSSVSPMPSDGDISGIVDGLRKDSKDSTIEASVAGDAIQFTIDLSSEDKLKPIMRNLAKRFQGCNVASSYHVDSK